MGFKATLPIFDRRPNSSALRLKNPPWAAKLRVGIILESWELSGRRSRGQSRGSFEMMSLPEWREELPPISRDKIRARPHVHSS